MRSRARAADAPATLAPPRLSTVQPSGLTPGDPAELRAHESYEGLRFEAADLAGRDLSGIALLECEFDGVLAHETQLRASTLSETRIQRMDAPVLSAPRSGFRDVEIEGSRLGSAELYEASWQGVRVSASKLGFINLRGATLRDVLFVGCTIDELDLGGATATRVAFVDCTVRSLDLTRATLTHVDLRGAELARITSLDGLRGATVSGRQALDLAPLLAAHLGLRIED